MAGNITQIGASLPMAVAIGGTGQASLTSFAPICGGTTSTGDLQSASTGISSSGYVLTSNGAGALPSFQPSGGVSSISITGDSGGALVGDAFTFTGGTTGLIFSGSGSTETLGGALVVANGGTGATTLTGVLIGNGTSAVTANTVTQYNTLVGGASNAITSISPSSTSGIPFISKGSSANPAFGTAVVSGGGTGLTTITAYAPLCGGTSSTNSLQSATTGISTSGYVLTSNGASALPSFQAAPGGSITITGDTGGGLTGTSFTFTAGTTGLSFGGSGSTETLSGTLVVANGGTGATTLTGVLIGNGTSAITGNAITQYDVLVGGASNAISSISPSATSGVPLISGGSSANPSFGTAVVAGGGTGIATTTAYAPICGGTTSTGAFQAATTGLSNSGYVLTSNGSSALPSWQASGSTITITGDSGGGLTGSSFTFTGGTTGLTFAGSGTTETLGGTLVVSNGGTGATTLTGVLIGHGTSAVTGNAITQYDVLIGGASNAISSVAPSATSGVPLISGGSSANPTFGTAVVAGGGTGIATTTAYAPICGGTTSTGAFQAATTGLSTSGYVLTSTGSSSLPTFQAPAASSISITGDSGGALSGNAFTITGGATGLTFAGSGTTETLGGTLVVGHGGTGATTLTGVLIGNGTSAVTASAITQYDVLVGGASNAITSVAPSATSGVPLISGGSSANPSFGTAVVAGGGTGITTTTAYAPICGGTTSTGSWQAASTGLSSSGYVLTSNGSSSLPSWQAASGGIVWNDVTGGSATLAKSNGYVADSASLTTFTMPTNNAIGDTIYIVGKGSGGWKIVYGTNQNIIFGSSTTTTTSGNLASTNANDCVTLVCTTASATIPIFTVMTSIGNITVA